MSEYDEEVRDLRRTFESIVLEWPSVDRQTTSEYPAYQVGGEVFAVLSAKGVALSCPSPSQREALEEEFETEPYEPDQKMITDWVHVEIDDIRALDQLLPYIQRSYSAALDGS